MAARLSLILGSAVLHLCTPYSPPEASAYADQIDTILAFKLSRKMPVLPAEVAEYRGDDAGVYVQRGMINFQLGHLNRSLGDFDRAIELEPGLRARLWQRGLTLYYLERYDEASQQFEDDVALNPNDTEESIWHLLSRWRGLVNEGNSNNPAVSLARLSMLRVGRDSRDFMRAAMKLFEEGDPASADGARAISHRGDYEEHSPQAFYADLYLALWFEAAALPLLAQEHMMAAVSSEYGLQSKDYMWHLAVVHARMRGWVHIADEAATFSGVHSWE